MDQYLSTVIIALITGTFSIITLIIQKRQDKVISKIDEQTTFIESEKSIKQRLAQKEKEREMIIHQMLILVLETNLGILRNTPHGEDLLKGDVYQISDELKKKFEEATKDIDALNQEYEMLIKMTAQLQKELDGKKN